MLRNIPSLGYLWWEIFNSQWGTRGETSSMDEEDLALVWYLGQQANLCWPFF